MQELASTQSNISEVLADMNMTNNPYSGCANTTASEIALSGYRTIGVGVG